MDIRSTMEFLFVGHPKGAVHVPWIDEPDWVVNPHFATEIRKLLLGGAVCDPDERLRPGDPDLPQRQALAGGRQVLLRDGLKRSSISTRASKGDLDEHHHRSTMGGWRFHGLPWEQC